MEKNDSSSTGKYDIAAVIALVAFAVFYGWNLAVIPPWYDELYSYAVFILKGPGYIVTHWPLPNNHVFFNLLSSLLSYVTGNRLVILRGVSFLALILTMILLYRFMRNSFDGFTGLAALLIFGLNTYTCGLGIQGRGYSLSLLFYVTALIACVRISRGGAGLRWIVLWTVSITLGAYTIPSNLYWIALLFAGTAFLLRKRLKDLFVYAVSSGVGGGITVLLYTPIWLTTASIHKFEGPLWKRAKFGFAVMRADGNIQSIGRNEMLRGLPEYIRAVFDSIVFRHWLPALLLTCALILTVWFLRSGSRRKPLPADKPFDELFLLTAVSFPGTLVLITIQSVLPFKRVLCYLGPAFTILCALACFLREYGSGRKTKVLTGTAAVIFCCILAASCADYIRNGAFTEKKSNILHHVFTDIVTSADENGPILGDEHAYLCYVFYIGNAKWRYFGEEPELAVLNNEQLDPEHKAAWYDFYTYDELPLDYMRTKMEIVYKDDVYTVFRRVREP